MIINTVEMTENGSFFVNKDLTPDSQGQMSVPDDMSNRHRRKLQVWLDAGNIPTPYVGPTALELWEQQMASSDNTLPRWAEDIVDQHGIVGLAQATVDKYNGKKALRGTKP